MAPEASASANSAIRALMGQQLTATKLDSTSSAAISNFRAASAKSLSSLITGEGSHQLIAQEISQFGRLGLKPIVFVLNNSGYLIERLLCKDPNIEYNDLAHWRYADLPKALGCDDWFTARVTTCGEFDQARKTASEGGRGVYIA